MTSVVAPGRRPRVARTVGSRLLRVVVAAVVGVVIARGLRPDGRGQVDVLVTIATMAISLGHLSIEQAHSALWHRHRAAIPANSLLLGPVIGLIAMSVAAGTVLGLGPRVVPIPGYGLLFVTLLAVPFAMAVLYLNNVLVLQSRVEVLNRAALIGSLAQVGALAALWALDRFTVGWVAATWSLSMVLPLLPILRAVRPRLAAGDLGLARRVVALGARYHPGCASLYLLYRVDVLILNALTTPALVGLYTVAVTLAELTRIVTDTLAQVSLPDQVDEDRDRAATLTVRVTRLSTVLAVATVGGMCLLAPVALPLVYGSAFAGSVPALFALAPGMVALGATRPVGNFLLRLRRPGISSALSIVAVTGNVGLNLLLIPYWGMAGSAVASSIGYAAYGVAQVAWFCRATGTSWRAMLPGRAVLRDLGQLRRS